MGHIGKIHLKALENINDAAKEIIRLLEIDKSEGEINCLAFYGEMGAGKTTIIKSICKQLGVEDTTSSPTFSIVNEYVSNKRGTLFHFDFYRINTEAEAYDLGYEEYFYSGNLCLLEWPEKVEALLPMPHYKIRIIVNQDNTRHFELSKAI